MPIRDGVDDGVDLLLQKRLLQRYTHDSSGLIVDNSCSNDPVWFVEAEHWMQWFSFLEDTLEQPLERRLSYASEAHETWRIQNRILEDPIPNPFFGKSSSQRNWINADWFERGLGKLDSYGVDSAIFKGRTFSSMASGQVSAYISKLRKKSYRHLWQDDGPNSAIIKLDYRGKELPEVGDFKYQWNDEKSSASIESEHPLQRPQVEGEGGWKIDSKRRLLIARDLLCRLAENIQPHVGVLLQEKRVDWKSVSGDLAIVWEGFSEASRKLFVKSGKHVLIAEVGHWKYVVSEYLSNFGLGEIEIVEEIDGHGGVKIVLSATVHPAISVGTLLGCWQRSEGRDGKAEWSNIEGKHHIRITARREITPSNS